MYCNGSRTRFRLFAEERQYLSNVRHVPAPVLLYSSPDLPELYIWECYASTVLIPLEYLLDDT